MPTNQSCLNQGLRLAHFLGLLVPACTPQYTSHRIRITSFFICPSLAVSFLRTGSLRPCLSLVQYLHRYSHAQLSVTVEGINFQRLNLKLSFRIFQNYMLKVSNSLLILANPGCLWAFKKYPLHRPWGRSGPRAGQDTRLRCILCPHTCSQRGPAASASGVRLLRGSLRWYACPGDSLRTCQLSSLHRSLHLHGPQFFYL